MAQALNAGPTPRRRVLFGLLDADGWGWASAKAFFWFIAIIFLLAYVPDRAYYFTVNRTLDLGILAFSPVNFCPDTNDTLPCPAPQGAVVPWQASPPELALPAPRTDGSAVQVGTQVLYIGGSDGSAATADVFVARTSGTGNIDRWEPGPALPEPRAGAGVAFFAGSIYVVGGRDEAGEPTTTTFVLTPSAETGALGEWQRGEELDTPLELPAPRADAGLVALGEGLLLVGGVDETGAPTASVVAATLDGEALGAWEEEPISLARPVSDAVVVQNGDYIWVLGGSDASGPVAGIQRGTLASGDAESAISAWAVQDAYNLPEPRTNAAGFAANGAIYVAGGADASGPRSELYWAIPAPADDETLGEIIPEWKHLPDSDLIATRAGAAALQVGPDVILVGGDGGGGPETSSLRANLAPQEPFFRLGLFGATVPALKIDGEIGQQLGYINAATVGGINFVLLIVIGWMFAHREQTRALFHRLRRRRH